MHNCNPFSLLYNIPLCKHTVIYLFPYQKELGLCLVFGLETMMLGTFLHLDSGEYLWVSQKRAPRGGTAETLCYMNLQFYKSVPTIPADTPTSSVWWFQLLYILVCTCYHHFFFFKPTWWLWNGLSLWSYFAFPWWLMSLKTFLFIHCSKIPNLARR